jgi:gliding motility-associated-like protein
MVLNRLLTGVLFVLFLNGLFAQKGKNGAKTITAANTIVNEFTALTNSVAANSTIINVNNNGLNTNARFTSTLTPGDLIMIIQMQGALIKLSPVPVWAPDSTYGSIYNYLQCGNYEFAEVKSTISNNQIELTCGLTNAYSSTGKTQIVRVPRYSSFTVTPSGVLTTEAWNGATGGVLAIEVDGNSIIDGSVNATGLGFRGGNAISSGGNNFYPFSTLNSSGNGSEKGEGIGSDRITGLTHDTLGKYCKGAPGNGGGGGNANNCGGGGGGNGGNINGYNGYGITTPGFNAIWDLEWPGRSAVVSSGGGKGGYGTSTTTTASINSVGPNDTRWGSFKRLSAGGYGGRPLDYSTGKIFMGGGGGAGHLSGSQSNGTNAGNGGSGGGLIYLLNYGTISGAGAINANGANGINAFGNSNFSNPTQGIDGAGGAGAGGTIILKSSGLISGVTINANGGSGGNQVKSGTSNSEGQGPGGGGSGGYIAATNAGFTQNVNGGSNGTTNASAFDTEFPMNGATSGDAGTKNQLISPSYSLSASANQTICTNQSATLTASSTNPSASIQWYNALNTAAVASGTVYVTPPFSSAGTFTVYAGSCPGIYRLPIIITVTTGPSFAINNPTICAGQNALLTVTTTATSYTWNVPGSPTSNTLSVSPASTTVYTINGNANSCVGSQTVQVLVNNTPTLSVPGTTVCSGNTATLAATGAASYTWSPGNFTGSTFTTNPLSNTSYTVTGANGTCSSSVTTAVFVNNTPTLTATSATICAGQTATLTASGASSFTWNPGNVTGSTFTVNPSSTTTVTVTGANANCTSQLTSTITVIASPSLTAGSQTICTSQTVALNASGAASYTWSTGQTTSSISVSPTSLTVYTVTGENNGCSTLETVTVTVLSSPTVTVNNAFICSGNSATLTAGGATSYTWLPGTQNVSSIVVSPTSTSNYTVTGANWTCTQSAVATVSVVSTPTLTANSATICAGQTATLTVSGAVSYTWNPGNVSGSTYTIIPVSDATVMVSGSNGNCFTTAPVSVTIGSGISLNVNSPNICSGETATLSVSGATSFTWNTGATGSTLNVSPGSTEVYTVTGTSGSCSGTTTATVTVANSPTVNVTNASVCAGGMATLIATGAATYTWLPGNSTASSLTVSPLSTESYTVTGANGSCTASAVGTVSVSPTPTLSASSATVCAGQNTTLTVSGASSYTWNPGSLSGNTYSLVAISNTVISVSGDSGSCISAPVDVTVTVAPSPTLTVSALNASGCAPVCVNFAEITSSNCSSIQYVFGDGTTGNTNNPNHCYLTGGSYTVTATCTNIIGCSSTFTLPDIIQVDASPEANFSIPEGDAVTIGTTINLTNTSTNANTYGWKLCGSVSTLTNITTTLSDTGTCCIQLVATNGIGCRDSVEKCILIIEEAVVVIPNVFTPNGDTKNDFFRIKSMGLKSLNCTIFDRWGLKIYEWNDVNGYWDGSTQSGPASDGTYFYIINYTDHANKSTTEKGFLNLFRQ